MKFRFWKKMLEQKENLIAWDDCICPITKKLINEPASTVDDYIYERQVIEKWLRDHNTNPATDLVLPDKTITQRPELVREINIFRERYHRIYHCSWGVKNTA